MFPVLFKIRRAGRGFSLLEFVIVAALVGFLAAKLLHNETVYQEKAEKTAVEQLIGTCRSALHLQVAEMLVKGNVEGVRSFANQNPMDWLGEKPKNYVGEYYAPAAGTVDAGNWYFDMQSRNLVYLPNNTAHLRTAAAEGNKLRFRVVLVSEDGEGVGRGKVVGVNLVPAVAYDWTPSE